MNSDSEAPELIPDRCPACGMQLPIEALHRIENDVQCPRCLGKVSFVRLKGVVRPYVTSSPSRARQIALWDYELFKLFPESIARQFQICPMSAFDDLVTFLTHEPDNEKLRKQLQAIVKRDVFLLATTKEHVDVMIQHRYRLRNALAERIPESIAREHRMVAIGEDGSRLFVATSKPEDSVACDKLRFVLNCEIEYFAEHPEIVDKLIEEYYPKDVFPYR